MQNARLGSPLPLHIDIKHGSFFFFFERFVFKLAHLKLPSFVFKIGAS